MFDSDTNGEGDYGTLGQLADPDGGGLTHPYIDEVLGGGTKGGYTFSVNVTLGDLLNAPGYTCRATPVLPRPNWSYGSISSTILVCYARPWTHASRTGFSDNLTLRIVYNIRSFVILAKA